MKQKEKPQDMADEVIFTLTVQRTTGNINTVTNAKPQDLSMLYRALRMVEENVFTAIENRMYPDTPSVNIPPTEG